MGAKSITRDADKFAKGIEELIGPIAEACQAQANDAVAKSTRRGAKQLRGVYTQGIGRKPWSEKYRKGFTSRVNKGVVTEGVVGNKAKPGLVHLLEKGHATLTGRRTKAYPHMEPAFEDMKDDFVKRMQKGIGKALK